MWRLRWKARHDTFAKARRELSGKPNLSGD
jgi:hypothetical protein